MPANDVSALKPTLNEINAKDGPLALALWAHLTAGDLTAVNNDLAKARAEGMAAQAATIQQFISTHKFDRTSKVWNPVADSIHNTADAVQSAVKSLNPLAGLFQANIWLRVAEVGIGVLLLAVGIAKLTNAIPAATKLAGAVGKLPIPV